MLQKEKDLWRVPEILDIEGRAPQTHLLRKIDRTVDFNRLYEIVEPLY